MLQEMMKKLALNRIKILFKKGLLDEKITPFDEQFYERLSHTYISCLPVSMRIKYLNELSGLGKCYDRSLYMFYALDDAVLVRGNVIDLELLYGKDEAGHGWIEIGDYVYDPSYRLKFEKDAYYKMFKPTGVHKYTREEYFSSDDSVRFYDSCVSNDINDFKVNGSRRYQLITFIPLLSATAELLKNEQLTKDLDDWLSMIDYDEEKIYSDLCDDILQMSGSDGFIGIHK